MDNEIKKMKSWKAWVILGGMFVLLPWVILGLGKYFSCVYDAYNF